jgi:hypothetical protein
MGPTLGPCWVPVSRRDQRGVHAVLLLLSYWILRSMPGPGAAETTLKAFYGGADRRRVLAVGLYLLPFAAIAFVWFIVALRMWVGSHGRPEHALFSNVQLVSGILFIALLLEAAAAFSIDAAVVEFSKPCSSSSSRYGSWPCVSCCWCALATSRVTPHHPAPRSSPWN